jgi:site-specific recombinase XerD
MNTAAMDRLSDFLSTLSTESTRRAYRTDLSTFIQFLDPDRSDLQIETVDAEQIQDFLQAMKREDLSMSTRRRRLSALRRFYDWLVEAGVVQNNPARGPSVSLRSADSEPSPTRFLSKEELEEVVDRAGEQAGSGVRDQALILTIIYGSLRRSEVASLNIDHVRPLGRHWVIDLPSATTGRGGYVKIPTFVADAVQKTVDLYETDDGPLWRSCSNRNRGGRMTPDAIYKRVRGIGQAAGVEDVDIELLRRSGLRLAFQSGARPSQIQSQARLDKLSSAARYFESKPEEARLQKTAGDFVKLDVEVRN